MHWSEVAEPDCHGLRLKQQMIGEEMEVRSLGWVPRSRLWDKNANARHRLKCSKKILEVSR